MGMVRRIIALLYQAGGEGRPSAARAQEDMISTASISSQPVNAQSADLSGAKALIRILPVVLLIYASFMPPELRLIFAGQNFYAPRLVAFLLAPVLLVRLIQSPPRIGFFDIVFFAGVSWIIISFAVLYGFFVGLLRGGALALDILLPYLIARTFITGLNDFRRLLIIIAPGAILIGMSLVAESFSGQFIVRPFFAQIFGPVSAYEGGDAIGAARLDYVKRLGLLRAYGPFYHPIHAGVFMAILLPLFAASNLRGWPIYLGIASGSFAFFSGSSAAYLSLILAVVLLAYDRITRAVGFATWPLLILGVSMLLLALELFSQNGVIPIISRYTLNPQSASYRQLIWEFGTQSVADNPLFGVGYGYWRRLDWMASTVDNYWLLLAIRHGFIVPMLFIASILAIMVQLSRKATLMTPVDRRFAVGFLVTIFVMSVIGFTVYFAGSVLFLYFLIIGASASLITRTNPPAPG